MVKSVITINLFKNIFLFYFFDKCKTHKKEWRYVVFKTVGEDLFSSNLSICKQIHREFERIPPTLLLNY
jgi:hypothetical protein